MPEKRTVMRKEDVEVFQMPIGRFFVSKNELALKD